MNVQITPSNNLLNKFMTDAIFAQVIFSRSRASSYNLQNKQKYNMNLRFIEVQQVKSERVKIFLSEISFYFSYTKMNFRHVFFDPPGIYQLNVVTLALYLVTIKYNYLILLQVNEYVLVVYHS